MSHISNPETKNRSVNTRIAEVGVVINISALRIFFQFFQFNSRKKVKTFFFQTLFFSNFFSKNVCSKLFFLLKKKQTL